MSSPGNKKASEEAAASALLGPEFWAGVQGGLDVKMSAIQLATLARSGGVVSPGDANYSIQTSDRFVRFNATLTADRTWSLPKASTVPAGYEIVIFDSGRLYSKSYMLKISTIDPGDVINGFEYSFNNSQGFSTLELNDITGYVSDGISSWTLVRNYNNPVTYGPFGGDTGGGGYSGLVPGPAAGNAASNYFLSASGGFAAVPPDPNPSLQTLNVSGQSVLSGGAKGPSFTAYGAAGSARNYWLMTGTLSRWSIGASAEAEGGSNAGSDFLIRRYDDSGVAIGDAMLLSRATGNFTIYGGLISASTAPYVRLRDTDQSTGNQNLFLAYDKGITSLYTVDANNSNAVLLLSFNVAGVATLNARPSWGGLTPYDNSNLAITTGAFGIWSGTTVIPRVTDLWAAEVFQSMATNTMNFAAGINFKWTRSGADTLAQPSSLREGQSGTIRLDGTGALSFNTCWDFAALGTPTPSAATGTYDYLDYQVVNAAGGAKSIRAFYIKPS